MSKARATSLVAVTGGVVGALVSACGVAGADIRPLLPNEPYAYVEQAGTLFYGPVAVPVGPGTRNAPAIFRPGQSPQVLVTEGLGFGLNAIGGDAAGTVVAYNFQGVGSTGVWTSTGGATELTTGGLSSQPGLRSVSSNGNMAGTEVRNGVQAMLWTRTGGLEYLPAINPSSFMYGTDVSANETVVGYEYNNASPNGFSPWSWTRAGGYVMLTGTAASSDIQPKVISDNGQVIAGLQETAGLTTPVVWRNGATVASALSVLTAGANNVVITDASADGSILVGRNAGRGVVWDASNSVIPAETFFASQGVDMSGWSQITNIYDMSHDGLAFLGTGLRNLPGGGTESRSFLVVIPSPMSAGLMGLAGVVAAGRRRR